MAEQLFIRVLNMSLTGSIVILAVLAMRICLRKVPRIFSYCLWAVVLFRLLCPVSFSAAFSLLGALEQPSATHGRMEYIPEEIAVSGRPEGLTAEPGETFGAAGFGSAAEPDTGAGNRGEGFQSEAATELVLGLGSRIWILGICIMAIYSMATMAGLKRKLKTARQESADLYVTDEVSTPFVMGFVRPRIYLPVDLGEREKEYVLLHERIHVKRGDHIVKMVSFLALCLHWFNPFAWVAFFLMEKDMEMSCDEAVIRKIGSGVKKEYTASLLGMATGRRTVGGVPLAFGEGDTGSRIRNVLRYRKPATLAVIAAAAACGVAAVVLIANPGKDTRDQESAKTGQEPSTGEQGSSGEGQGSMEEQEPMEEQQTVYYGVVADVSTEEGETPRKLLVIPGFWDLIEIPEADKLSVYFEREEQGLLPGDMVAIAFPAGEEVMVQETWPTQFGLKAESITVLWSGCGLEQTEKDAYRFTFAAGVVPGYETAQKGDVISFYWEAGDSEAPAYYSRVPEGEESVLLASEPILEVTEDAEGIRYLTVELDTAQIQQLLKGFGFHVRFELEKDSLSGQETALSGKKGADLNGENQIIDLTGSEGEDLTGEGTYRISVRSVSRSARVIDSYLVSWKNSYDEGEELAFSENCVFKANYSMDRIDYQEISFDTFADLIGEGSHLLNKPCILTFREGLIQEAILESIWCQYGIGFSSYALKNDLYSHLMEKEGADALDQYYRLDNTETLDVADCQGEEIIEVYVGNAGDGDSGIVLFKDEAGNLLCTQDAHRARAGWNNIYLGETEEGAFILNVEIEDRWDFGGYGYWVYRLDPSGGVKLIAGSRFDFDFTESSEILYDDDLFREWVSGMTDWLEQSHLILSSQEGEIRTETIGEADKYNYETLSLKDRSFE